MKRTIDEIADELCIERPAAEGLVKYLFLTKLAKFRGERPNLSGRGKGAHVYEVVDGAADKVAAAIKKLEGS